MTADKMRLSNALAVALRNAPVDIHVSKLNATLLADAALTVVTEHWNERLEAEAQKLDEISALEGTLHPAALAAYESAARRVRALKEGQQ